MLLWEAISESLVAFQTAQRSLGDRVRVSLGIITSLDTAQHHRRRRPALNITHHFICAPHVVFVTRPYPECCIFHTSFKMDYFIGGLSGVFYTEGSQLKCDAFRQVSIIEQ